MISAFARVPFNIYMYITKWNVVLAKSHINVHKQKRNFILYFARNCSVSGIFFSLFIYTCITYYIRIDTSNLTKCTCDRYLICLSNGFYWFILSNKQYKLYNSAWHFSYYEDKSDRKNQINTRGGFCCKDIKIIGNQITTEFFFKFGFRRKYSFYNVGACCSIESTPFPQMYIHVTQRFKKN